MAKALVLLSGGVDSAACIAYAQPIVSSLEAIFIDYGQAAAERERESATNISRHYGIALQLVRLTPSSPVISGEIPGRNAFLILAALMLRPQFVGLLMTGIHSGTQYYDCSQAFVGDIQRVLDGYFGGKIQLSNPFLLWTKDQIFEFCRVKDVPLGLTWSCESSSEAACGFCMSCKDRAMLNACTSH